MSQPKSALIIGATGACGRHALKSALESPNISKLTSIGRREVAYSGPGSEKLVQKIVDFDNLAQSREAFAGHDVAFLALGTTRADAGSAEAFYKIDHDYVIEAAKLFKETNAENPNAHVMYVSSTGSDVSSSLLYPRTKGEVERDLIALGLPRTTILQPGMLIMPKGDHRPRERIGETIGSYVLAPFGLIPWIRNNMQVSTVAVGRAMVHLATTPATQQDVVEGKAVGGGIVDVLGNKRIVEVGGWE